MTALPPVFIALLAVVCLGSVSPAGAVATPPSSFADTAEKLLPSVVNISSTQKLTATEDMMEMPEFPPGSPFEEFFDEFLKNRGPDGGPAQPSASLGSGFIVDAEKGYIVTNNHVIRDAEEVRVTLHDDTTLDAKIIGRDEKMDLAVLQVKPAKNMKAVSFGDSSVMRVGDWVVAIGNPFGLGGTVTAGIISARQRDINAGPYDDFIQTDASINRGNSGGPMFNVQGEVIGINTAIFSPSGGSVGIGFAIPSNLAKPVVGQLIEFGRTRRGWIGVRIQSVTDEIAESLGLGKTARGALVATVSEGGPAAAAGIKQGDVILEFNGKPIREMRALPRTVAETSIGSTASVVVWRDGKTMNMSLKVEELEQAEQDGRVETADHGDLPAEEAKGDPIPAIGLTVGVITDAVRANFAMADDVTGLVILGVDKDSEAKEKGLSEGDVIVEINQQPVTSPAQAADLIAQASQAGRSFVLLLVNGQGKGDVRFVAIKPKAAAPKSKP